eukprot:TRINITY_DN4308_c0_g1_i1.p1 TRINITY_DN4308_c0_g1~~TRINITY_DN4308_c0_g1_i1.p1  ORF type:complete len:3393 (-),score=695.10 TRINITY_DN4308_c0_g1_i1:362-10540(-)
MAVHFKKKKAVKYLFALIFILLLFLACVGLDIAFGAHEWSYFAKAVTNPTYSQALHTLDYLQEAMSEMLTTILSFTFFVPSYATSNLSPHMIYRFLRNNFFLRGVGVYTISNVVFVVVKHTASEEFVPREGLLFSVALMIAAMMLLPSFIFSLFAFLDIAKVVASTIEALIAICKRLETETDPNRLQAAKEEILITLERLTDTGTKVFAWKGKSTCSEVIDALFTFCISYAKIKRKLDESWFTLQIKNVHLLDSFALSETEMEELSASRSWVEYVILWHMHTLYMLGLRQMPDLCQLVAINIRSIAEDAAKDGDAPVVDMCVMYFNTQIRCAFNAGQMKAFSQVLHEYCLLAQNLMTMKDMVMSSAYTRSRRLNDFRENETRRYVLPKEMFQERVVRISGYLRYYGQLALQQEAHTVLAAIANESANLCIFAFLRDVECHQRLLDIFLRLGVEDDPETRGFSGKSERCIVRAKIALATYYLALQNDPKFPRCDQAGGFAQKTFQNIKNVSMPQIDVIYRDLMISERPEIGEAEELAAEQIVYLTEGAKVQLQNFRTWFKSPSTAVLSQPAALKEDGQILVSDSSFPEVEKIFPRRNSFSFEPVRTPHDTHDYESYRFRPLRRSLSQSSFDLGFYKKPNLRYFKKSTQQVDEEAVQGKSLELNTLTLTYSGDDRDKWVVNIIVLFIVLTVWIITLTLDSVTGDRPLAQTFQDMIFQPDFQVRGSISRLGETMSVQLIIILTATGLLLNMASARFTPFALRIFYDDPVVKAVGGLCTFCQVFHILTNFFVIDNEFPKTATFFGVTSLGLVIWLLIPFFAYLFNFLSPITVIERVQSREKKYMKDLQKRPTPNAIHRAQDQAVRTIEQLADLASYALDKKDKETVSKLLETMYQKTIHYGANKNRLPIEWFTIPYEVQQSLDFLTIRGEDIQTLSDQRNWYEWKVGRQYQSLFESALTRLKDMCCFIAICTRRIAEDAIIRGDYPTFDITLRLFNSYLHLAIDKGDVRTFLFNISQYRELAIFLLKKNRQYTLDQDSVPVSDQAEFFGDHLEMIEDRISRIGRLFRNYAIIAIEKKLFTVAESISDDLATLVRTSYTLENSCYLDFLDLLLNIDGGPEHRQNGVILPGIQRVLTRHALFHLSQNNIHGAITIVHTLRTQSKKVLEQNFIDLTTLESSEHWEVNDRSRCLDYIPFGKRAKLVHFFQTYLKVPVTLDKQPSLSLDARLALSLYPPMVSVREWRKISTRLADPSHIDHDADVDGPVDGLLAHAPKLTSNQLIQSYPDHHTHFTLERDALQVEAVEQQNKGVLLAFFQRFVALFGLPLLATGLFFLAFALDELAFGTPISEPLEAFNAVVSRRRLTGVGELNMKLLLTIFTASPVLLQISTIHFSPVVVPLFARSRVVVCTMAYMVISNLFLLFCNISIANPTFTDWTLVTALVFVGMVVNVMFPYHAYLLDFVRPNQIIRRITKNGLAAIRTVHPLDRNQLAVQDPQQSQLLLVLAIDRLADIALRALSRHEKNVAFLAVDAICLLGIRYSKVKSALPESWFGVNHLRTDPDFITMQDEFVNLLQLRHTWVEWKVLRQFQNLFSDAIKQLQDLCYIIGIHTRRIAESAAERGDVHSLLLCIRYFNTYLRYALNHGEVRALNVIMHQYSKCGIKLLEIWDKQGTTTYMTNRVELGRAVVLIASFFKYYASIAQDKNMLAVVEIAAHDLQTLVSVAFTRKSDNHDELFNIFLQLGQQKGDSIILDGVIRAQLKLAAFYVANDGQRYAKSIREKVARVPREKIIAIWNEFLGYRTADVWELNDRGSNINYLGPREKQCLAQFLVEIESLAGIIVYDETAATADRKLVDSSTPVVRIMRRSTRTLSAPPLYDEDTVLDLQDEGFLTGMGVSSPAVQGDESILSLGTFRSGLQKLRRFGEHIGILSAHTHKVQLSFSKVSSLENRPYGYVFTDRFRKRIYVVLAIFVFVSFLINFTIDVSSGDQQSAPEVGGLGEIMAVILTVVLTVTAIFLNIAAGRFTPAVTSLFLYNPTIHSMLSFFVMGTFYIMLVDFTVGEPTSSSRTLFISILVTNLSLILLIPYFSLLYSMLDPPRIIRMILESGLGFVNARSVKDVASCQVESSVTIERLSNLGSKVMQFNEKTMSYIVIDALSSYCIQYGDHKSTLHPEWFRIKDWMRMNPDFVTLSNEAVGILTAHQLWVEWKTFCHFRIIFSAAMGSLPDMCNMIGLHMCKISKAALRRGDYHVLELSIKFFNTFLRLSLTGKDASAAQSILFHYRRLVCSLVKTWSRQGPQSQSYFTSKIIQINDFLSFYGTLFNQSGMLQVAQVAAYEMNSLCEHARRFEFEDHKTLLSQSMNYAKVNSKTNPNVVRAHVKLATWYLAKGYTEDAHMIAQEIAKFDTLAHLMQLCSKLGRLNRASFSTDGGPASGDSMQDSIENLEINDPGFRTLPSEQVAKLSVFVSMLTSYYPSQDRGETVFSLSDDEGRTRSSTVRTTRIRFQDLPATSGLNLGILSTRQLIPSEYLYYSSSTSSQGRVMHAYDAKVGGRSATQVLSVALPIISLFLIVPTFAGVRADNLVEFTNTIAFESEKQLISSLARLGEQHSEKTRFLFMVTLTAAQSACLRYSGISSLYLVVNPRILMALLWVITASVLHVSLAYLVMEVAIPNYAIFLSVFGLCFTLVLMAPYFVYTLQQMVPIKLVKRITESCTKATSLTPHELEDKNLVYMRQLQLFDAVEALAEFGLKALQMGDKSVVTVILESLSDIALTYGKTKGTLVETTWFRTGTSHRGNYDYISMTEDAFRDLCRKRTWFEWKVMRQVMMLYSENIRNARDHTHTLSLAIYKIAVGAIDREDFDVLDLATKFLNTFLRIAATAGDVRTGTIILDKYRQLGEYLIHLSSPGNMRLFMRDALTESERRSLRSHFDTRVLRVGKNLVHYIELFRKLNHGMLVEVAALDFEAIVQRAHETSCDCHRQLLALFLQTTQTLTSPGFGPANPSASPSVSASLLANLPSPTVPATSGAAGQGGAGQDSSRGKVLRGVRRAQIRLATHYLAMTEADLAWVVAECLREESRERLESIVREMQTRQSSNRWEIFTYRSGINQLTISQCSHIPTLMHWITSAASSSGDPGSSMTQSFLPPPGKARTSSSGPSSSAQMFSDPFAFLPIETVFVQPLRSAGVAPTIGVTAKTTTASGRPLSGNWAGKKSGRRGGSSGGSQSSNAPGAGSNLEASLSTSAAAYGQGATGSRRKQRQAAIALPELSNPSFTTPSRVDMITMRIEDVNEDGAQLLRGMLSQRQQQSAASTSASQSTTSLSSSASLSTSGSHSAYPAGTSSSGFVSSNRSDAASSAILSQSSPGQSISRSQQIRKSRLPNSSSNPFRGSKAHHLLEDDDA